jgi:DNA-binding MarR family transcriptional regulator
MVALTDQGRALVEEVARQFGADVTAMVEGLSTSQQQHLSELASRVVAHNA